MWLINGYFVEITLLVGVRLDSRLRGNDGGWCGMTGGDIHMDIPDGQDMNLERTANGRE